MPSTSDPTASGSGASAGDTPSLETGLAALKQGNYGTAIAHLESVCAMELNEARILKAQMGLVNAYEGIGHIEKAIALCQTLSQSETVKVQTWGEQKLQRLRERYPQLLSDSRFGVSTPTPSGDPTGFVPLDGAPVISPDSNQIDGTGFVAFETPQQTPKRDRRPQNLGSRSQPSQPAIPTPSPNPQPPQTPDRTPDPREPAHIWDETQTLNVPHVAAAAPTDQPTWRNAGRAQKWQPLRSVKPVKWWLLQAGSAIALFWLIRFLTRYFMEATNDLLIDLPFLEPWRLFYRDPTAFLLLSLIALGCVSPWIIDGVLKFFYQLQPLPLTQLLTQKPEAAKLVQQFCRQRRYPLPKLGVIPNDAPLAITYGSFPQLRRIVVSQGLLDQLAEDEVATIYAAQLGEIEQTIAIALRATIAIALMGVILAFFGNWKWAWNCWWIAFASLPIGLNLPLMSLMTLILQIPYSVYWLVARGGEILQESLTSPFLKSFVRVSSALIAAISYSLYWVLRWPTLWVGRMRVYYCDRTAVNLTGNPNGYTRALLKIAIVIAKDVQKKGAISWLLESFDLLTPIGYQQGIHFGSVYGYAPVETLLAWDHRNPARHWLAINHAHPPIGDRLYLLNLYAQFWKLESELNWEEFTEKTDPKSTRKKAAVKPSPWQQLQSTFSPQLLLQGAPYFGFVAGLSLGLFLWFIGWIASLLGFWQLEWMMGDRVLLMGCIPIGISLGIFLRINPFFPDITPRNTATDLNLANWISNPAPLPVDGQPVQLQGTLLGRTGVTNWLGQDLHLQTSTGLIKLHPCSPLGVVGGLWPPATRPVDYIGQQVSVTGWLRRGVTPWLDIEQIKINGNKILYSYHPIWSTILASGFAVLGAYIIYNGA